MNEEPKKKGSNKFKEALWDYYLTNREITKGYDEAYAAEKGKKKKWNKQEKIYLGIIILALLLLGVRYFLL